MRINKKKPISDYFWRIISLFPGSGKTTGKGTSSCSETPFLEELEPRLLFSADSIAGMLDNQDTTFQPYDSSLAETQLFQTEDVYQSSASQSVSYEIVFVDAGVDDYQQLLSDLQNQQDGSRRFETYLLDSDRDGVEQISDLLAGHQDVDAIHILSHGDGGRINLGNSWLDNNNLDSYSDAIAGWSQVLGENADLLIYGCELASDENGKSLVYSLSHLTGADVAASDDLTGSVLLGGDWELEYQHGQIETGIAVSAQLQNSWQTVLAVPAASNMNTPETYSENSVLNLTDIVITSADTADVIVTLTLSFPEAGTLSTGTSGSVTSTFDTATGAWTANGAMADVNALLAAVTFTPASGVNSNFTIETSVSDSDLTDTVTGSKAITGMASPVLWAFTEGDVTGSGATELPNWKNSHILQLADPGLTLGNNTDGNWSARADLDPLSTFGIDVSSLDYVNGNITLGGNGSPAINLEAGDLLLKVDGGTFGFQNLYNSGGGSVTAQPEDIVLFHPDSYGDYSKGTFTILLDEPNFGTEFDSFTLVEKTTKVGTTVLPAGTFVVTYGGSPDLRAFVATDVGENSTVTENLSGGGSSSTLLLDGSDVSINQPIGGLEIIETDVTIGGVPLLAGDILITLLNNDNSVGNGVPISASKYDVIALRATSTGSSSNATATMFLDGGDVHLNSQEENLVGFTLSTVQNSPPSASNLDTAEAYTLDTPLDLANIVVSDVDSTDVTVTLTLSDISAGLLNTGTSGSVTSTYNAGSGVWTASGAIADINTLLAGLVFTPAAGYNSNFTISTYVSDGLTPPLTGVKNMLAVDAGSLWLSTDGDVTAGGQPATGVDTWQKGDVLAFGNPNFSLGSGATDGSFSVAFDADTFSSGKGIDAMHYVTKDIQIGASNFQLKAGDLILSVDNSGSNTFDNGRTSAVLDPGFSDSISVAKEDVFVFRPDSPGNYTMGTFAKLLVQPAGNYVDIRGITLVEENITVGGRNLQAGDFLYTRSGASEDSNVYWYHTNDVGPGYVAGTSDLLVQGGDTNISITQQLHGLHLVHNATTLGTQPLSAGTLLLSLNNPENVGNGAGLNATEFDIFALNVIQASDLTGATDIGDASASLLFDGAGVGMDAPAEEIDSITLTSAVGNSAPTAIAPNAFNINENTSTAFGLNLGTLSASDPDSGDSFSYGIVGGTDQSKFFLGGTNSDELNIDDGFLDFERQSSYQVVVRVTDSALNTYEETITVTINNLNDNPVATNLNQTKIYTEGAASVDLDDIVVSDDDTGEFITATLTLANPTFGVLTRSGLATYNSSLGIWMIKDTVANVNAALAAVAFVPAINNDQDTSIGINIVDGGENGTAAVTGSINLNVTPVNDVPVAAANTVSTPEGSAYTFAVNDFTYTDVETDALVSVTLNNLNLGGGTLVHSGATVVTNGMTLNTSEIATLVYTPASNANGLPLATFDFTVNDADTGVIAAQMDINVTAVNDAPTVNATASDIGTEDTDIVYTHAQLLTLIGAADVDDANSVLTVTISNVTNGSFTMTGGTGGVGTTFTFTPALNFVGNLTFDYQVSDDESPTPAVSSIGSATVAINAVNDIPVASANTVSTTEENAYTFTVNDFTYSDVETDALVSVTITNLNLAGGTLLHSSSTTVTNGMTLNTTEIATLVYTPTSNTTGTPLATFDFTVNDADNGIIAAQMDIDVTAANDAPTVNATASDAGIEDTDIVYTHAQLLTLIGASDIDDANAVLSVAITNVTNGSLAMTGGTGGVGTTFTFTPALNFVGNLTFDYQVSDDEAPTPATSALGTATVALSAVNDAPVATASVVSTPEGSAYTFAVNDFGYTDVETDALVSVTLNNLNLAGGTLVHSGATVVTNGMTLNTSEIATLVYTPASNANGLPLATFDFTVNDADAGVIAAQMDINVTAVNDAPATAAVSVNGNEDAVSIAITLTGTDVDGTVTAFHLSSQPANGMLYTDAGLLNAATAGIDYTATSEALTLYFVPAGNWFGTTSFQYAAKDNSGVLDATPATATITVNPVNDAPTAANLSNNSLQGAIDSTGGLDVGALSANDVDPGDTASYTIVGGADAAKFSITGVNNDLLTIDDGVLSEGQQSSYEVIVRITDSGGLSHDETLNIVVIDLDETISSAVSGSEQQAGQSSENVDVVVVGEIVSAPENDNLESGEELDLEIPETVLGGGNATPPVEIADEAAAQLMPDSFIDQPEKADLAMEVETRTEKFVNSLLDKLEGPKLNTHFEAVRMVMKAFDASAGSSDFMDKLDELRENAKEIEQFEQKIVGSSMVLTTGLSVGYIVWLVRGGVLLSSVLSSLPAWRFIDPLPILATLNGRGGKADEDNESLESLVRDGNKKARAKQVADARAESQLNSTPEKESE